MRHVVGEFSPRFVGVRVASVALVRSLRLLQTLLDVGSATHHSPFKLERLSSARSHGLLMGLTGSVLVGWDRAVYDATNAVVGTAPIG